MKIKTVRRAVAVCSTNLIEARDKLRKIKPNAKTHLVTIYEHADFRGANSDIYGEYGNCDANGYRIPLTYSWRNNLSSVQGFNDCNRGNFTQHSDNNHSRALELSARNIEEFNDNTEGIRAHHG
ncbi:hypothetical protein [Crossiella cryophila]|uniref:Uncharacterized protein n=1 Tax=Crossiella cryophila TaxID=43355 RepID=A0A7W7FWU6_9PSEU|nr:hypothetical protein [Crossiella cryophila]MBB4680647.1 hypothetical protein [Crossiella cryophila]